MNFRPSRTWIGPALGPVQNKYLVGGKVMQSTAFWYAGGGGYGSSSSSVFKNQFWSINIEDAMS
jgi:hypothetical protein